MSNKDNEKKAFKDIKSSKYDKPEIENDIKVIEESQILIGRYEEAPDYLKDNEYIKTGYLLNINSVSKVFRSLFKCHNETMNVWTHLLGTFTAIFLIFYTGIYISAYKEKILTVVGYENMINNIKNIISPWIDNLNQDKIEEKYINPPSISIYIENISNKTNDLFNNILPNNQITSFIKKYLNDVKNLINKILEKIEKKTESKVIDDITLKWEICRNKVLDILNREEDSENQILNDENDNNLRRWPLFIMLFAAIVCLGFSASFHLFGTMSKNVYQIMSRLDYAGITFLIAGSCFPPYFYFFYCESFFSTAYLSFISVFSFSVFCLSLTPDFHIPRRRRLRGILFLTLGISTAIPILHLSFLGNFVSGFEKSPHLIYWYLGGLSYVFGGLMYTLRIPEKYFQGKFDFIGASHQILHIFVDVGFILHYLGCVDSYYYRVENKCPVK